MAVSGTIHCVLPDEAPTKRERSRGSAIDPLMASLSEVREVPAQGGLSWRRGATRYQPGSSGAIQLFHACRRLTETQESESAVNITCLAIWSSDDLQILEGSFEESERRCVTVRVGISRATCAVVLQKEYDLLRTLTKENLVDCLIALDYFQYKTQRWSIANQTLLESIEATVRSEG